MKHLFMEERRRFILERINQNGRISVSEMSEKLNVSAVTIRHDLSALEAENLLKRTHGGAVRLDHASGSDEPELSYDLRRHKGVDEKSALGKAAAALVEDGSAIALDASTTVCSIIPHLADLDSLTVVTNNLMAMEMLVSNPRIEVLLPAGKLRRDAYSVVGRPETLPDINLNIGFLSAWGISGQAGLTEVSAEETAVKKALLTHCMTRVLLVDSTKWGQMAAYTYARPDAIDIILTTDRVPNERLASVTHPDVRVVPVK